MCRRAEEAKKMYYQSAEDLYAEKKRRQEHFQQVNIKTEVVVEEDISDPEWELWCLEHGIDPKLKAAIDVKKEPDVSNSIELNVLTVENPITETSPMMNAICPMSSNVSMEYHKDWYMVSILVDSGAGESVAPPDAFPQYKIYETDASKSGLEYTAAGGHTLLNKGASQVLIHTLESEKRCMTFQIADVSKNLGSVSRIVATGHRIIFDTPDVGSYIENKQTGKQIKLRQHNGVYLLDVWVAPNPSGDASQSFQGQVKR